MYSGRTGTVIGCLCMLWKAGEAHGILGKSILIYILQRKHVLYRKMHYIERDRAKGQLSLFQR